MYDTTANQGDPPDGVNTFHMWDEARGLFYRDDRYLGTSTFWGRGNGWAMAAMAQSLRLLPAADPHRAEYAGKLKAMAASLLPLQGADGCWRASLLNASGFPAPETTGSSYFTFAIAEGIRTGLLPRATYIEPLERAWRCLAETALHADGRFGFCQPIGGSPASTDVNATNDFCVGQFLSAGSAVAQLAGEPEEVPTTALAPRAAPITNLSVVVALTSSKTGHCPEGTALISAAGWDADFNQGARGDYVYLCAATGGMPITALVAFVTPSDAQPFGDCPAGTTKVPGVDRGRNDLNTRSRNVGAMFLCYARQQGQPAVTGLFGVSGGFNGTACPAGSAAVEGAASQGGAGRAFDFDPRGVGLRLCAQRASA